MLAHRFGVSLIRIGQQWIFSNPITGLLPIEQAFLNVGNDGSIENVDAVYAPLRENPAYLERVV
jgi:hypothetical protein